MFAKDSEANVTSSAPETARQSAGAEGRPDRRGREEDLVDKHSAITTVVVPGAKTEDEAVEMFAAAAIARGAQILDLRPLKAAVRAFYKQADAAGIDVAVTVFYADANVAHLYTRDALYAEEVSK
jgi:hypothetical protein